MVLGADGDAIATVARHSTVSVNTLHFLPSVDEWYKAAYYDPNAKGGVGGYCNWKRLAG
jgi:hypothetical protein